MTSIASSVSPVSNSTSLFNSASAQRTREDRVGDKPAGAVGETGQFAGRTSSAVSGAYTPTEAEQQEKRELAKLAARDREVRAHEAAHASVGGVYAGAPSYSYQRGPDGKNYAVGGEVSIDVSPVAGDPQATIVKAQIVRRAALAPAEPSLQDRAVASAALAMEQNARRELMLNRQEEGAPAQGQAQPLAQPQAQQEGAIAEAVTAINNGGVSPGALLDTMV